LLQDLSKIVAGRPADTITVEDRRCLSIWAALKSGYLQGLNDKVGPHIGLHRPTHNPAAEQINDHGQKQPGPSVAIYVRSSTHAWFGAIGR